MKPAIAVFLLPLFILLDQLSKYTIRSSGGFYICNEGIAFGLKLPQILFWVIWLAIIAIVGFQISNFLRRGGSISNKFSIAKFLNFQFLGLILILSGAISNIIDRLYFGCVIDFIDLKFWPVFNLADSFIVIGVIILIIKHVTCNMKHAH